MGTGESVSEAKFHTARPDIRFMVEVIDPQIGETVFDPADGSAGFPAQAYLHMEQARVTLQDREMSAAPYLLRAREERHRRLCWGR